MRIMKRRVNLTIDANVLRRARRVARQRHTSISQLVEDLLEPLVAEPPAREPEDFVEKWAGNLRLAPRDPSDPRREHLWKKYGLTKHADSD
jgi:hypothetical protein